MRLQVGDVLSAQVAAELCSSAASNDFEVVAAAVLEGLRQQPLFVLGAQPVAFSRVALQWHAPESEPQPLRPAAAVSDGVRADLVALVFLSPPSEYEGGDLQIDTGFGPESCRPEVGSGIAFPGSASYRIAPVVSGGCWVATASVQSAVRQDTQREILYDVGYALHLLELFGSEQHGNLELLRKCRENLLRGWAEV